MVLLEASLGSLSTDGNEEGPVGQVSKQGFCMSKRGNTTIQELETAWSGQGSWNKGLRAPSCYISLERVQVPTENLECLSLGYVLALIILFSSLGRKRIRLPWQDARIWNYSLTKTTRIWSQITF